MTDFVTAEPTKEFFVEMLTRDIELEDAIFDLLDNCLDGLARISKESDELAYKGRYARILIDSNRFLIEDNCGGIPEDIARGYAFMMGRPNSVKSENAYTVGTYGIGMKRAIFKIGRSAEVKSTHSISSFVVSIRPNWISNKDWKFPFSYIDTGKTLGTSIEITSLNQLTRETFDDETFLANLATRIKHIYSYVMENGFEISINSNRIEPYKNRVIWEGEDKIKSSQSVSPYIYSGEVDGVEITVIIGLYRPLPKSDEIEESMRPEGRYSSEDAGWTVVANDRVIIYKDKTKLTGWGADGLPQYHTQFISITGMVFFKARDARNLPVTTTKRSLNLQSNVWQTAFQYMKEGMRIFIDFTNKWKEDINKQKEISREGKLIDPATLLNKIPELQLRKVNRSSNAVRLIPKLPEPEVRNSEKITVRFTTSLSIISLAASILDEDENKHSLVAQRSLEYIAELGEE